MLTVIIFLIILGILVFVHEFGHFIVARRNGVKAEEFGFGFPPRIFGFYRNDGGKRKIVWGSKEVKASDTIYSVNWIPLGGFVKIMGEDGEEKNNPNSFASKPAFSRVRILAAGVFMNFVLAAVLLSLGNMIGIPQAVEDVVSGKIKNEKIQIIEVQKDSPAQAMGITMGDEIAGAIGENGDSAKFSTVEGVQDFINSRKGQVVKIEIKRGNEKLELSGIPRNDFPADEGSLGISLAKIAEVSYPWYQAIWIGIKSTFEIAYTFILVFAGLLWRLVSGQHIGADVVSGPVGIAVLTGQFAKLGFVYLLRFAALLSINLAIINALPIPALDGGRILFILIEKIKGSPLSQKLEQRAHNVGFALLISLMVFVTARDLMKFDLIDRVINLF